MSSEDIGDFKRGKQPENIMAGRRESSRMRSSCYMFLAAMLYTWTRQLYFKEYLTTIFFPPQAYRTANYMITYWKGSNDRDSSAGDHGFLVIQGIAVKDYHQNMIWAGKAISQTSPLCGLPVLFPSWLQVISVSAHWLLMQISPKGTYNLSSASCLEPGSIYRSSQPGIILFHDRTNLKLWKKIIWNHLKMATHCHFF